VDVDAHLAQLRAHGVAMADDAASAGLDAAVPTCPDWTVRDLLQHTGRVHRWAAMFVETGRTEPPAGDSELAAPPGDAQLDDWFRAGHRALVDALTDAADDLACWTFLPAPTPRAFWARRQAHETAIHHADAAAAAGRERTFDTDFAVDGIDELLLGFFSRARGRLLADPPVSLGVRCTDTDVAWTIAIGASGREVTRGTAGGDCVVSGPAADLYPLLWNRRDAAGLDVSGDTGVLALWRDKATVTWS
jgi:uncharacterized protein (TIGR03083 family)